VVIGYSSGHVDKYNLQSGLHRGTYGENTGKANNEDNVKAKLPQGLTSVHCRENKNIYYVW
jgi:hypothetical protein